MLIFQKKTMKLCFIIFISIFLSNIAAAQKNTPNYNDSARFYYETGYHAKSKNCANKALADFKKSDLKYLELQLLIAKNDAALFYRDSALKRLNNIQSDTNTQKHHLLKYEIDKEIADILCDVKGLKNFRKAADLLQNCLTEFPEKTRTDSIFTAEIYNSLGNLYDQMSKYKEGEKYFLQSMDLYKQTQNTSGKEYVKLISDLGLHFLVLSEFAKAGKYIDESFVLYEQQIIKNKLFYAHLLGLKATLEYEHGNYNESIQLNEQCLQFQQSILATENPDIAITLNRQACAYDELEVYENSEKMYLESLRILEKNKMETGYDYFSTTLNLGGLYKVTEDLEKAEKYYLTAQNSALNLFGEISLANANILNQIAMLEIEKQNLDAAEKDFLKVREILSEIFDESKIEITISLNNLAKIYYLKKDYDKAINCVSEAYDITKKYQNRKSNKLTVFSANLFSLYNITKDYEKALPFFFEQNERILDFFSEEIKYLNEDEIVQLLRSNTFLVEIQLNYIKNFSTKPGDIVGLVFNNALMIKNFSLNKNISLKKITENSKDSLINSLYSKIVQDKNQISKIYSLPLSQQSQNIDSLILLKQDKERQLIFRLNLNNQIIENPIFDWQQIKDALKPNEAAVEFVKFEKFNKQWTDTSVYGAFILRSDFKNPKFVYLCSEPDLQKILEKKSYLSEYEYIYNLYSNKEKGKELYQMLWQPMESLLSNISKIYISKTGILNQISFSAIPMSGNKILADKYNISDLSSTKEIIESKKIYATGVKSAVLYGGITFSSDTVKVAMLKDFSNDFLPGSLKEVREIDSLFQKQNIKTQLFTNVSATEKSFKSISETVPEIIHISTHGFYFSKTDTSFFLENTKFDRTAFKNELNRSGLLFSEIQNLNNRKPTDEDGILTAFEISNMSLQDTKIVVLSACQTGLGDFGISNEMSGLIRAFKLAGVQKLIVSMWKVPDAATQIIFSSMYQYFASGDEVETAFRKAQNDLRKNKNFRNAYYWAGFVLID